MKIYISTDSNEAKALLEKADITDMLIDNYSFSQDIINFKGVIYSITNIPIGDALEIQKKIGLSFSPSSIIECSDKKQAEKLGGLVKKLSESKVFVAVSDNGKLV